MSLKLDGRKYRHSSPKYIAIITQPGGAYTNTEFWDGANVYNDMVKFVEDHTKEGASAHVFTRHWTVEEKVGLKWREDHD